MGIWVLIFILESGHIGIVPGFVEQKYCKDAGDRVTHMWENTLLKVRYLCVQRGREREYERSKS